MLQDVSSSRTPHAGCLTRVEWSPDRINRNGMSWRMLQAGRTLLLLRLVMQEGAHLTNIR